MTWLVGMIIRAENDHFTKEMLISRMERVREIVRGRMSNGTGGDMRMNGGMTRMIVMKMVVLIRMIVMRAVMRLGMMRMMIVRMIVRMGLAWLLLIIMRFSVS